jgi:hypothetical protein
MTKGTVQNFNTNKAEDFSTSAGTFTPQYKLPVRLQSTILSISTGLCALSHINSVFDTILHLDFSQGSENINM